MHTHKRLYTLVKNMMSVGTCECLHLNHKTYKTQNPTKQMSQSVLFFLPLFSPPWNPCCCKVLAHLKKICWQLQEIFLFIRFFPYIKPKDRKTKNLNGEDRIGEPNRRRQKVHWNWKWNRAFEEWNIWNRAKLHINNECTHINVYIHS